MSDTDKDKPSWVRATWWEPWHGCSGGWRGMWARPPAGPGCDLPPEPVRSAAWFRARRNPPTRCQWWPISGDRCYSAPPRWYVLHRGYNRERVATRVTGRRAIAEYRATGHVTVDPPVDQHRHGASWDWA